MFGKMQLCAVVTKAMLKSVGKYDKGLFIAAKNYQK